MFLASPRLRDQETLHVFSPFCVNATRKHQNAEQACLGFNLKPLSYLYWNLRVTPLLSACLPAPPIPVASLPQTPIHNTRHPATTFPTHLPADSEPVVKARLHAGRGLALEGISEWQGALQEYDLALEAAQEAGCVAGQGGK